MSKAKSTFKKTDAKRLISVAESAGLKVDRIEMEVGKISLITSNGTEAAATEPLDGWIASHARSA